MAISRSVNVEMLWKNSYYAMLINNPESNSADELGRTPIHNIVSIKKSSAPAEVYVEAIEHLIKLGFDIDGQDVNGRSAIHIAIEFQNVAAVTSLLKLGADINTTDSYGKTPLSFFQNLFSSDVEETQKKMLKICLEHICKMQKTELHINSINSSMKASFEEYWKLSSEMEEDWETEKERMMDENISTSKLTLSSFLYETGAVALYPKMRPAQRQVINEYFCRNTSQILTDFPNFVGLLLLQHRKAKARLDLIKIARTSIHFSINYILPEICCDKILDYFCNDDLKVLTKIQ